MWIFAYGSLIWKINFQYKNRIPGFIQGYKRKFYQLSTDHRGTTVKVSCYQYVFCSLKVGELVFYTEFLIDLKF